MKEQGRNTLRVKSTREGEENIEQVKVSELPDVLKSADASRPYAGLSTIAFTLN